MDTLSHIDAKGRLAMVDVSTKPVQRRIARASGVIHMTAETVALVRENAIAKGDVLTAGRIAGIQAAKDTGRLIPLCHPLGLDHVDVEAELIEEGVRVTSQVVSSGRTGAEMEALTAVAIALLTVYDMCKAVDKSMCITNVTLLEKRKEDIEHQPIG